MMRKLSRRPRTKAKGKRRARDFGRSTIAYIVSEALMALEPSVLFIGSTSLDMEVHELLERSKSLPIVH